MHYENVNRIYYLFRHFFIFIIIDQNICFFSFYVNLVFHIQFLWIMWITLCITQFSSKINHSEMWITFAPKSTLSTFPDKFCAICQTTDFYCFSSSKLLSHIFFVSAIPHSLFHSISVGLTEKKPAELTFRGFIFDSFIRHRFRFQPVSHSYNRIP